MNEKPKISVIITNYNHGQYIENAIKSIVNQTYDNLEIIVIDDGSIDNSKEIIKKVSIDKRIKTIFLPENKGKWFALNKAIEQATGSLIAPQDADDECSISRLDLQLKTLLDQKSMHNLCGFIHVFDQIQMDEINRKDKLKLSDSFQAQLELARDSLKSIGNGRAEKNYMDHQEVLKKVYQGFKTPGINHYFVGHDYEVHGASTLFYKQLWEHGMKFMPGNMDLRCQIAEDSDHNTKLTLLLQKTSVLKEPLYFYRRNSGTNNAWKEAK